MYVYENIRMSMYEEHLCSYSSIESVRVMRNVMNERINMINIFNSKYGEALAPTLVREENILVHGIKSP